MIYKDIISGQTLFLRNIEVSDCTEKYVNWLNDKDVNKYLESRHFVQDINSVKKFVSNAIESNDTFMFAIINKENNEHIGNVKIGPIHPIYNHTEFGCMIGEKKYWSIGLELYYIIAKFCFIDLNLHKITGGVISGNIGAIKLFESLGFKREGCIREHIYQNGKYYDIYRYGILKEEYLKL